jgi:UDP-N-acetylglucosamine--N-acetylmuramyl-(pentapeptide) pyrophosphoryl-undecaprenol N-acetylglucosamine transferase
MIVGGSLGSAFLNARVRTLLPQLLERFEIIHVCGRGNTDPDAARPGYAQFEFVTEPFADLLAAADLVLSRAGANALMELVAARRPMLLVPLTTAGSRGDQIENADWAVAHGLARRVVESELEGTALVDELDALLAQREDLDRALAGFELPDASSRLLELIREQVR